MARYIDADALLQMLPDDLPYKGSVKRVLMQAPDADVVPKSEVEKLQCEIKASNRVIKNLEGDIEVYREAYKNVRSKVAREIFEEIEQATKTMA